LPARERVRGVHWVRPEVVAQIEFGSWTDAGILRHASFQGVRDDKPAINVGQPESLHAKSDHRNEAATMPARKQRSKRFASDALVELTHPDRVLYSDLGLTKQQLADYYARIADLLLPHIAGRPLALLRCPGGVDGKCFFQKHATAGTPEALRRVPIAEKGETEDYLVVDDVAGLRALAQMSILELHPWGSLAGREEQPDRLIFDLDPGPAVKWTALVEAAFALRDALARLHLKSFVKTSGSQGLHVVSPLTGRAPWSALKQFARAIAEHFAQEQPARYTAKIAKAARQGRIFIDYLRNDRGATAVAPYSPRARAGAPVSMPLSWEELPSIEHAAQFTVPALLAGQRPRDPWRGFHRLKQRLPDFAFQET
jgi:bifunctional non-homologous end joining protein LigD